MTTLTEFHLFPFLPWELRNRIWELAIRPLDRSGAHFFDVDYVRLDKLDKEQKEVDIDYKQWLDNRDRFYKKQQEKDKQDCRLTLKEGDIWVSPIRSDGYRTAEYGLLSARVPATTLSASGVAGGNPSVYMVDGGLWTACKHSREVMMRAFESDKWDKLRMKHKQFQGEIEHKQSQGELIYWSYSPVFGEGYPYEGLSREGIAKMASTFYTSGSLPSSSLSSSSSTSSSTTTTTGPTTNPKEDNRNDVSATTILGKHYFTVLPHRDLFIFRLSTRFMTSEWRLREVLCSRLVHRFPLCAQANGFLGFTDFAIEFNPAWPWDRASILLDVTLALGALHEDDENGFNEEDCVLWFIDYRLIPKPKAGTASTITTTPIVPDIDWWRPSGARTRKLYSQRVFHDANGGRYVPVEVFTHSYSLVYQQYVSVEDYVYPEGSLKPIEYERGRTCTDSCSNFIDNVLEECWMYRHERAIDWGSGTPPEQEMPWAAQWGILAYLPPGTEEGTGIHTS